MKAASATRNRRRGWCPMGRTRDRFLNRELSWARVQSRVLEEATDPSVPLLERLKFLSITSANLDEFFMVRVGGLWQLLTEGKRMFDPRHDHPRATDSNQPAHARTCGRAISVFLAGHWAEAGGCGHPPPGPSRLARSNIEYLERLFDREIYPIITPRRGRIGRRLCVADWLGPGASGAPETRQANFTQTALRHHHSAETPQPVHHRARAARGLR